MTKTDTQKNHENEKYRIGILSDTHGLLRPEVLETLRGCHAILHGGDINTPDILDRLGETAPVYAVRGNNDKEWAGELPETASLILYGIRFFMVHKKKDIPKDVTDGDAVDVIIYGHSHKYEEKREGGKLLLNPGSCGPRRFTQPVTLAVLETDGKGSFEVRRVEIAHFRTEDSGEREACEKAESGDMVRIVEKVMKDTDRGLTVDKISRKNHIARELAEQICRLYLTHPGVSVEGIMGKMGL